MHQFNLKIYVVQYRVFIYSISAFCFFIQIQVLALACSGLEGYDSESTNIESSGISEAGQALDETCNDILNLLPRDGKITSPLLSNTIRLK